MTRWTPILVSIIIPAVLAAEGTTLQPQFLDVFEERAFNFSPSTSTPASSDTKKDGFELIKSLEREKQLKKELEEAKTLLANNPIPPTSFPIKVTTPDPAMLAQQQSDFTSKLFGPSGIFSILSPKIMDQQDAAQKLIPALTVPGMKTGGQGAAAGGQQPFQLPGQSALPQLGQPQQSPPSFPQQAAPFGQQQPMMNPFGGGQQPFFPANGGMNGLPSAPVVNPGFGVNPSSAGLMNPAAMMGQPSAFAQPGMMGQFAPPSAGFGGAGFGGAGFGR